MSEPGTLTVITGSMFSGKSEELIRLVRRALYAKKKAQVFKSAIDDRWSTASVITHSGVQLEAAAVKNTDDLRKLVKPETQVIGIEEVQFFDEKIVSLCEEWAQHGKSVIAAGLDQDFRGKPFGVIPLLLSLADEVIKLRAICMKCGRDASRTQRIINGEPALWDDPVILIGASEKYEARCRKCHEVRIRGKRNLKKRS
jgi:thymidine kinase